jgi:histidinol phosphatase-like enzyme
MAMKAVFVNQACLLRDAGTPGLSPQTAEALQALAETDLYTVLLDVRSPDVQVPDPVADLDDLCEWIEAADGRVDAVVECPHQGEQTCRCWGTFPGFLWEVARQLDVHLEESYLVCDSPQDVLMGYAAECRPLLILNGRSIETLYDGFQPEPADFPIALDLTHAMDYLICEENTARQWGHPRPMTPLDLSEGESLSSWPQDISQTALPAVTTFTPVPSEAVRPMELWRYVQRDSGRLLLLIVVGGVWLSLGIAYLLTHLYRVQPFPEFVWYLTLQFIPRPLRGFLFILTGAIVLLLAFRSIRSMFPTVGRWDKKE